MAEKESPMPQPVQIAPSILSADFAALGAEVRAVTAAGADAIHVDVMDGHFVPNLTIGPAVVAALRPHTGLPLDTHLMIAPAGPYIEAFATAGADIITVHPEAEPHLHALLGRIRALGKKAGLALNPGTPASIIAPVLDMLDLVLVMTVNPGFGGQKFLHSQLEKIAAVRAMLDAAGSPAVLQVDGGITPETARMARNAGAVSLVAGTSVFRDGPGAYAASIRTLRGE